MSFTVNKVTLVGQIGRDPDTKFIPSGKSLCKFSVATEQSWKDERSGEWQKKTDWHNVILWGKEKLAATLEKGCRVYVEGRLETRSYEDANGNKKYQTDVVANEVINFGVRNSDSGGGGYRNNDDYSPSDGEDVPF